MGIKLKTPQDALSQKLEDFHKEFDRQMLRNLHKLGLDCVNFTKDRPEEVSWKDDSSNLRSSIGYTLLRNQEHIRTYNFQGKEKGIKEGRREAEELAKKHKSGYKLIVVAGMDYASYVESIETKDVLASTYLFAHRTAPKYMQNVINKLKAFDK